MLGLTIILLIIYLTFISLGLPDAIIGSAWPVMHGSLNTTIPAAGLIVFVVSGGTIIASFFSARLIARFGTVKVTIVSVLMTALGLLGISFTPNFFVLCLLGIPLGLGAGAVDSALNNFVALHYKSIHMNWLHCFWGIGATMGPAFMSLFLAKQNGWRSGFLLISGIQFILVVFLFISLPLWKQIETNERETERKKEAVKVATLLKLSGAKSALIGFFCYCAVEMVAGFWGSTYLVLYKKVPVTEAAKWLSLFYVGITLGRFLSGLLALRFKNKTMIRIGQYLIVLGAVILFLPLPVFFK